MEANFVEPFFSYGSGDDGADVPSIKHVRPLFQSVK